MQYSSDGDFTAPPCGASGHKGQTEAGSQPESGSQSCRRTSIQDGSASDEENIELHH